MATNFSFFATDMPDFSGAACKDRDPETFFTFGIRNDELKQRLAAARAVCATCRHVLQCKEYAVAHPSMQGVWGGTSTAERHKIRAQARKAKAAEAAEAAAIRKVALTHTANALLALLTARNGTEPPAPPPSPTVEPKHTAAGLRITLAKTEVPC